MDLGDSVNTDSEEELRAAYDLLAEAKKAGVYQAWVMDEVFDKMEAGEAAVATYYAGDYLSMLENNEDLVYVVPEEGSNWSWMPCVSLRTQRMWMRLMSGSTSWLPPMPA